MRPLVIPIPPHDDLALARQAAAGSAEALAALYTRHGAAVHAVAYRLTGSAMDAEDVLHDVFVGLPEALRGFAGTGALAGWIRRVAVRVALMRMRAGRRRGEVPLDAGPERAARPASPGDGVDVARALARLPDGLRAVFVLKEVEGYSHQEIGEMLGIRPNASEVRLFRARKALQTLLRSAP